MTVALKLKHPVTQKKKGRNTKHRMRKEGQKKTIDDTVAMASLTRDKEGEVFGAKTADLEREEEKHV